MQIITLTTDWGNKDYYIGLIKSQLYRDIDQVNIVDISHNVEKFDTLSAAFVVKNACLNFPKNTIHIIDVNTFESSKSSFLVVRANEQYFICTDNGLPSLVFENIKVEIYDTSFVLSDSNYYTFAVWDNFCKIAKIINQTNDLSSLGVKQNEFAIKKASSLPFIDRDMISCTIIYIDDYGNAYLNMDNEEFAKNISDKNFEITLNNRYKITKISQSYQDVASRGDALLTISVTGKLELALREGNFAKLLGYKVGSTINIAIK
ncbi:MAG: SAM-dependent chlorinase/fluorinase [Bacteroidota bacterium]|nr:SAM-dependent chlorinase/fluorinase [Bacteroidota bacterium]